MLVFISVYVIQIIFGIIFAKNEKEPCIFWLTLLPIAGILPLFLYGFCFLMKIFENSSVLDYINNYFLK
jgi:hypothetical protein